ncbi:high-affinity branched-chain amino acid transporter permease LivH [Klebsiella pneumoniae]|uniref:High-affinity branched-chain amino acid transporter permease LivH n=1 Tax=Klebsiella pneumoniae TaxID=573 RepID=A0A378FPS7_KLEPN|nr:high-affinity branched-chain amino acid transporter permease LivH [Klebsiella pneumoniae]
MIGSYVSFMIIAALMMMGIDTSWLLVAAGFVGAIVIAAPTAGALSAWPIGRCVTPSA